MGAAGAAHGMKRCVWGGGAGQPLQGWQQAACAHSGVGGGAREVSSRVSSSHQRGRKASPAGPWE